MAAPTCSKNHRPMEMVAMYNLKSHVPLYWQCAWIERDQWANLYAPECGNRIQNPEHPDYGTDETPAVLERAEKLEGE